MNLLAWGWLMMICMIPELVVGHIVSLPRCKSFREGSYYRHARAAGSVLAIFELILANVVGFSTGYVSVCVRVCACVYMYVYVRARGRARVRLCGHLHVRACVDMDMDVGVGVCVCSIQRFTLLLCPLFFRLKINADVNVFVICIPTIANVTRTRTPTHHARIGTSIG